MKKKSFCSWNRSEKEESGVSPNPSRAYPTAPHLLMVLPTDSKAGSKTLTLELCETFKVKFTSQNKKFFGILLSTNNKIVWASLDGSALAINSRFLPETDKQTDKQRTTNHIKAKEGLLQGLLMSFRVCLFREHHATSHYLQGHKSHPINKRKELPHTSEESQEVTVIFLTVTGLVLCGPQD